MDSHDNHGNGHGHGHGHGHQTRFGYPQRPSINFYFAKEKWVDPLKDPYHGLRFDIKNPTRKFLSRLGWCYGVFTGAFITYIALSNLPLYTYPHVHPWHRGPNAHKAPHGNPFDEFGSKYHHLLTKDSHGKH